MLFACLMIPLGLTAQMSDLIISEYGEGSSNNKYLELYNGTGEAIDLSNYVMWKIINEGNWYERAFPLSGILEHGETYLMVNPSADSILLSQADTVGPTDPVFVLFNGNEAYALSKIVAPGDTVIIDVIGEESGDVVPENWVVAGVADAGAEHTWVRKATVCDPNPVWSSSAGTNADDSEWIILPQDSWENVGIHSETCSGVAEDLFFSEYGEGSENNKYLELYNGTGEAVDLSNYVIWKIINEGNWYERTFPLGGILEHGATYTMVNYQAGEELLNLADTVGPIDPTFVLFNGNEAFALTKIVAPGDTVIIDVIGEESGDVVPESWVVAGVVDAGAEHTWIRKPNVCGPNPVWSSSAGTNAEDSEWILLPQDSWADVGQHTMACEVVVEPQVAVTFQVNMSQATVAPEGVHLAGDFQGWNPETTLMSDDNADGIWEITLMVNVNQTYEFKYVNGDAWGEDESVPSACAMNQNRFVDVGEQAIVLDAVCYASCGPCSGEFSVTFRVDMREQEVSPDGVHIAGNFQGWDPETTPMDDADQDDIWEITIQLGGNNTYQYKFINGDGWGEDESIPVDCAVDNNRSIDVGTTDLITTAFCFASCEACITDGAIDLALDRSLRLFPNPNKGQFELAFDLPESQELNIRIYTPIGQLIQHQTRNFQAGHNQMSLNVATKGLFFVEISGENGRVNRRAVVE